MKRLTAVLGAAPAPQGEWEREARFVSTAALRTPGRPVAEVAGELATRLRGVPGVAKVDVRPNGFLVIEVAVPGEIVREILDAPPPEGGRRDLPEPWPDFPRTWGNPGFVVRYAYVRAGAVGRWARGLGMPDAEGFPAEALDDPSDRAVLRVLAELPSRRASRDPGWPAYLERLAEAYHDAFEHAPPLPKGDEGFSGAHLARVRLAEAVRRVLGEGLGELGVVPPGKI
ncbi:DALR anticodon-binding domain-containing protein [Sphaerisporangium fuscum]|uniref:DALR anticodon-binding domain-containing protein n=1 Tax=Sphaerisporangium fuscum TaxID=2835868 RepID=UPI001BDCE381|nr:DALR anticodon-binding domain-containing protein [Sphaerisporangium fuscum]